MFTTRAIENGRIEFNIDDGLDQDLLGYCQDICFEKCGVESFDPECGDCHVTRLYYAMVRLAEYKDIGLHPKEIDGLNSQLTEVQRRGKAAEKELDDAQPCFACAGFRRNGGKCFGAGTCRVRDIASQNGVEYKDLAYGESWCWRGPEKVEMQENIEAVLRALGDQQIDYAQSYDPDMDAGD